MKKLLLTLALVSSLSTQANFTSRISMLAEKGIANLNKEAHIGAKILVLSAAFGIALSTLMDLMDDEIKEERMQDFNALVNGQLNKKSK